MTRTTCFILGVVHGEWCPTALSSAQHFTGIAAFPTLPTPIAFTIYSFFTSPYLYTWTLCVDAYLLHVLLFFLLRNSGLSIVLFEMFLTDFLVYQMLLIVTLLRRETLNHYCQNMRRITILYRDNNGSIKSCSCIIFPKTIKVYLLLGSWSACLLCKFQKIVIAPLKCIVFIVSEFR